MFRGQHGLLSMFSKETPKGKALRRVVEQFFNLMFRFT